MGSAPEIHTLAEHPQYTASTYRLIEENFPRGATVKNPTPLAEEFPLLLNSSQKERVCVLTSENQVCSAAAYRVFDLQCPISSAPLRVAGIGLVVTDPAFRGRGYARQVQQFLEEKARKEGCVLSVLWSDLVSFYQKQDYVICGREHQWILDREALQLLGQRLKQELSMTFRSPWRVAPLTQLQECSALYEAQALGPKRDWSTYTSLLRIPNTWAWGAWKNQELKAYAFLGKGRDLRDTLHECLGEAAALPLLLEAVLPHLEERLRVHHPVRSPWTSELEHWLGPSETTALAFFKLLNTAAFVHWLNSSQAVPSGLKIQYTSQPREQIYLSQQEKIFFESDDPTHLLQLFLGPWHPTELEDLPDLVKKALEPVQLIDPYFWGFDSV